MSKIERIETNDFSEVQAGDTIAICFVDKSLVMAGLKVTGKPGKLAVNIGREYHGGPIRILKLADVTDKHKLEGITRTTERPRYRREVKEIDFSRYDSKKGSRAALEDALETVQSVEDYFEYRVSIGDPLLDQWMVDAYESSQKAVKDIQDLLKALGHWEEK